MANRRKKRAHNLSPHLFTSSTPIPNVLEKVTLSRDAWDRHIEPRHPEMVGRIDEVRETVENPTAIVESSSSDGNLMFFDQNNVDPLEKPLTVVVGPTKKLRGTVRTAYHANFPTGSPLIYRRDSTETKDK